MGRYVGVVDGDFEWGWKFWFGQQCSNFGAVIEVVKGDDVYVDRYIGENGEYVAVEGEKEAIMQKLRKVDVNECPVCHDEGCSEATREMVKDFINAVEEYQNNRIVATFFVEY